MKFLFNAFPKSGSQTYAQAVRRAIRSIRRTPSELPELEDWIICQYDPVVHLGNFGDDIIKVCVLRNPIDAITINTERHFKGFLGKQINGVGLVDSNGNIIENKTDLTTQDREFIDHQIERYNSYINCMLLNIDNIVCFTNEQTRTETATCTKNLLHMAGVDYLSLPNNSIQESIIDNVPFHPFAAKIKEYVLENNSGASKYQEVMDIIHEKQSKYHIPMQAKRVDK
jgi:hypothetical protein